MTPPIEADLCPGADGSAVCTALLICRAAVLPTAYGPSAVHLGQLGQTDGLRYRLMPVRLIRFDFSAPRFVSEGSLESGGMILSVTLRSLYALVSHLPVSDRITRGCNAIFGHVARLPDNASAHQAMLRQVKLSVGRPPDPTWKRPPGRPRTKWTDQLRRDNNNVPTATLWRQAIGRGHSKATLWSEPTTRERRRRHQICPSG